MNVQFSAIWAWVGGLISWLVSGCAAHIDHQRRFRERRERYQGACEQDADYAETIGDVDVAVANLVGKPDFIQALLRTHSQPLFVGVLTGGVTFFGSPGTLNLGVPLVLWVCLLVGSLLLTSLSSPTLDSSKALERWWVVIPAWLVVLVLFVLLALLVDPGSAVTDANGATGTKGE